MQTELPRDESLIVDNGGVVLLWPFLNRYFDLLDLQKDGVFLGDSQRWRAVYLLHYLSHGTLEAPESALLLNKVLCGVDSAAPLEPGPPLSQHEHNVSQQVLLSVMQYWRKLKDTDAEGLRSAFLRRNARLTREEDHWSLQVERRALDVLLPSLPWSLGSIKLSWMARVLRVHW